MTAILIVIHTRFFEVIVMHPLMLYLEPSSTGAPMMAGLTSIFPTRSVSSADDLIDGNRTCPAVL